MLAFVLAATLHVSAASSLTDVLQQLAPIFEKATGTRVALNFGSSGSLARQVAEGAPADVLISADERQMDRVANFIVPSTRRSMASNSLVVVVPSDLAAPPRRPLDLTRADIRRIAVGDPETVPAGGYAQSYLNKVGVWEQIARKLVPMENVRAVLAAVESGNVDCGIVYRTDALIAKRARIAFIILGSPPISYPAAVVASSADRESAARFLDFLQSPRAGAVFKRYGFFRPTRRSAP